MSRVALPQPAPRRRKRAARLGELERPHHAPPIVWMHCGGRGRIPFRERGVRARGAGLVVDALPAFARSFGRRGRESQLRQGGAEVEAGPAGDDCRPAGGEDRVDCHVRQSRE